MFELKRIEKREVKQKNKEGRIETKTKWVAHFSNTMREADDVPLSPKVEYDHEPTELIIGSSYKINLEE